MKRENNNTIADQLLSTVTRDPLAPHYSEETFRRKVDDSNRRAIRLPLPLGGKESHYLVQREWQDVVEAAGLTERQLVVLSLRLEGHTFEYIGRRGGHTKQGAQSVYFQAAKKLIKSWFDYRYRGLAEVFREEVRRGAQKGR